VSSTTELTTAVTDAFLALECLVALIWLGRHAARRPRRVHVWRWAFALCGLAAGLGAVVHGFLLPTGWANLLWHPLTFCMGSAMALLLAGAVGDWLGFDAACRVVPWGVGAATLLVAASWLMAGAFVVFAAYAAVLLVVASGIYLRLAMLSRFPGAGLLATALGVNLAALAVQASDISLDVGVPLDHNGVFHLLQMLAIALLAAGLAPGMRTGSAPAPTRERG
jgi:hypothetical protein